jgi:hydrogenase expression/formation protein HypE
VLAAEAAETALQRWRDLQGGEDAAIIGELKRDDAHVILETELGGARILEELEDDPLPRIC